MCYNVNQEEYLITMTIVVNAFLKKKEIKEILANSTNPKYEFVGEKGADMEYEVTDVDGTAGDLLKATEKLIKSQPWAAALVFRVIQKGQLFKGQKI